MKKVKVLLLMGLGVMWSFATLKANVSDKFEYSYKVEKAFYATYSEEEIKNRILNSSNILAHHYDASVPYFVKDNLYYGRRGFSKTLGRTQIYFPIIEQYLKMYGLPDDLKHLVIVESHANPHATSYCGAKGLWQMMPETARRYGLRVNSFQDDRKDPRKATEAAIRYLSYLYEFLNRDWTLAIAAYNCGEGRVRRAIRQANSYDYNKIKYFLPKQTQKYIPAIIAANYSIENYAQYGVRPANTPYSLRFTNTVKVFDKLTFAEISNISNTPIAIVKKLNPSYSRGYVPTSKKGNYIILPSINTNQLSRFLKNSNRYAVQMRF